MEAYNAIKSDSSQPTLRSAVSVGYVQATRSNRDSVDLKIWPEIQQVVRGNSCSGCQQDTVLHCARKFSILSEGN